MLRHLLPGACLLCDQPVPPDVEVDLCGYCLDSLPWNHSGCLRCAIPLDPEPVLEPSADEVCADCRAKPPPFLRALVPLRYQSPVSGWIARLKDQLGMAEGRVLGTLLADAVDAAYRADAAMTGHASRIILPDAVIPVPLTRLRLARRGHNQALTLAMPVARRLGLPLWRRALVRVRSGPRQRRLGRSDRLESPANAFRCSRRWPAPGPRLAVVDDVLTTGATVTAVSLALLAAGAAEVHVWCAARTPRRRRPGDGAGDPARLPAPDA
jgi:ComF family protein